jgi:hypothetical protein
LGLWWETRVKGTGFLFSPLAQTVSRSAQRCFAALETRFLRFLGFARGGFDIWELENVALGALTGEEWPGGWWSNR